MAPQPRTIDLDELPGDGGPGRAPGRFSGRRWRPLLGATTAVVLGLTMYADARPETTPWATHQFTVAGQMLTFDQHTLYVVRQIGPNREAVTLHSLADGLRTGEVVNEVGRLVARDPQGRHLLRQSWFAVEGGHLLYVHVSQVMRDDGDWQWHSASTTAFVPGTIRPLWTYDGLPIGAPSGDLVLLEDLAGGSGTRTKTAVHLPTGDTAWRLRKAPGLHDHDQRYLANHSSDGYLTTYDLASGGELATVREDPAGDDGPRVVEGLVLLPRHTSRPSMAAYDADSLARRWSVEVPAGTSSGDCRTVVCLSGDRGMVALDPDSGAEIWSLDWPVPGHHTVEEMAPPWPPGWLLSRAFRNDGHAGPVRTGLLDARTGESVLDLAGWHLPSGGGPDQLIQRREGGRTWFGRLTLDPPGVEVLGSTGRMDSCRALGHTLACQAGHQVEVWLVQR
jgi:hypothetical protein